MGHNWTSLAVFLLFFSGQVLTLSPPDCNSFDTGTDGWYPSAGFYWKWSGAATPDTSNIPSFVKTSEYMWFQDQSTPPQQGSMDSPDTHTLYYGDTVQASIFRHIIIGQENDTDRPVLRFVATDGIHDVLYSYDYDWWSPVSITCTNISQWQTKQAQCCQKYPCTGHFRVDGQVLIRDELLGIDDIGINGGCSGSTPTAPPTPAPSGWCCHFSTPDLCEWSPFFKTVGWVWSGTVPDPIVSAITPDPYIYIVDTTGPATSPNLTSVPDYSIFTISYYFESATIDTNNKLVATFTNSAGITVTLSNGLPLTGPAFNTVSLPGSGLCSGAATCVGTFTLATHNSPSVAQTAALKGFTVNSYCAI